MSKYVIMQACACGLELCDRTIHGTASGGKNKVRIAIKEGRAIVATVTLDVAGARAFGEWLLKGLPARPMKRKIRKDVRELMPWQMD